ncbi:lipoic acid synthetase [Caldanaerobius fijiensis DSM 17918]|uniref:Lipoyl synthase n=1 Tax=Caldanaerobius fijiensis DSM 17918 TaxID=1121256 RepID=A0A1M4ZDD6_9THEO|nr:lipoyl synthase [Caldanaerobius fijiensis]SHF15975.1 lipoic acid synthetase [Caldanaerobius fijiensis DSM 17918]
MFYADIKDIEKWEGINSYLLKNGINTVCREAFCPNMCECYANNTATFLILGKVCTRNCTFCCIDKGIPEKVDVEEPKKIAEYVKRLGLKYAVITSVTRDDLPDEGSNQFARVIDEIKKMDKHIAVEVLIPDFHGRKDLLDNVLRSGPDVVGHNIETVERLYREVRPKAVYKRSLEVLCYIKQKGFITKSGIMLGLGETKDEVKRTIDDLCKYGCDILTIGQYLQPDYRYHDVVRYVPLDEFEYYKNYANDIGIKYVLSLPRVRSSYRAFEIYNLVKGGIENGSSDF